MTHSLLVVYYSQYGATSALARLVARGINMVDDCEAVIRCVPGLDGKGAETNLQYPVATLDDLKLCDGLALGSPSFYGGIAAPLKAFIDSTTPIWMNGTLSGKPACVFTSSGTHHGGQETALISLMVPLLHHGMLVMGLPYTEPVLNSTVSGGTPYGPSHVAGSQGDNPVDDDEKSLCLSMGKRLAKAAIRLKG